MPVKMSREELEFWRELFAPFPPEALSVKRIGGTELTYIDKRSLSNRLDTVVGPAGWRAEYRDAGGRGLICKLSIFVPQPEGSWGWVSKEDGGSDEGMTKKVGGQQVEDTDNSFKSEFTNSFRRAAQDAWGIGRYLYQKGIPLWLDPSVSADAICGQQQTPAQVSAVHAAAHEAMSSAAPQAKATPASAAPDRSNVAAPAAAVEKINIPAMGAGVYQWAKDMESRFRTVLLSGMKEGASNRGHNPGQMYAWPQEAVTEICREAIDHIKSLPTYRGEFDHIQPQAPAPIAPAPEPPPVTATAPPNTGDPLSAAKKELMAKISFHIEKQVGDRPTNEQMKAAFQTIASQCQTGAGHVGEVPDSLSGLTDGAWIRSMINLVDANIQRATAVAGPAVDNEIPF